VPEAEFGSSLVAAAARYTQRLFGSRVAKPNDTWHTTALSFWDDTPEVRFAGTWVGNMMGMSRLYAGKRLPDGSIDPLPPEHEASKLVASIGGGPDGQAQLMTEHGPKLVLTGEAWTVIWDGKWYVRSTKEARPQGKVLHVEIDGVMRAVPMGSDDGEGGISADSQDALAIRTWQPHPARFQDSDSPIRSAFAILEELRLLNAAIAAIARSRITGRGIVFMPQGTSFPSSPGQAVPPAGDLIAKLIDIAGTAYSQPDSAAATVPIFLEVPADATQQPMHMEFDSAFDTLAVQLREECIRRFATGMEFSPGILMGEEGNHWTEWLKDETSIRQAVSPRNRLVANAYTTQWMVPVLQVMQVPDAKDCVIGVDEAELRIRSNRSQTAVELYDRGEITGDALRRETNFDDADKPSVEQKREKLLVDLVGLSPGLAPVLLPALGINVPGLDAMPLSVPDDGAEPLIDQDVEIPVDESPGVPRASEGLMAAADGIIVRAMERAGNRLKASRPRSERPNLDKIEAASMHVAVECPAEQMARFLDGAWVHVPEVAARYEVDPTDLTAALDHYVRELLAAGVEHAWEQTAAALAPLFAIPAPPDESGIPEAD
jgi:hypothetical protein